MNIIKFALLMCFVFLGNPAFATKTLLVVPFQNITLNPNAIIQASFNFGPHQIIFCFANDIRSVVSLTWPRRGVPVSAQMPLALTTRGNIDGQLSDGSGVLKLQNTPNHGAALVSCVFGF